MSDALRAARDLEGEKVKLCFSDGREVMAVLFSATTDTDGRQHVVFGDVAWSSEAGSYDGRANTCYYEDGKELVSVERA